MLPDQSVPWDSLFGRLSLDSLPLGSGPEDRIVQYTFLVVAIIGLAILAAITWKRKWGYLWKEWLTSVDHKKLGIMYMILGTVMLLRGFSDAIMMRSQHAVEIGRASCRERVFQYV